MGVGSMGSPISYEVDGKQYIGVPAGWAGGQMLLGSLSAQHGWVGRNHPRRMLTFVLDGDAKLPPTPPPSQVTPLDAPEFKLDRAIAEKGRSEAHTSEPQSIMRTSYAFLCLQTKHKPYRNTNN